MMIMAAVVSSVWCWLFFSFTLSHRVYLLTFRILQTFVADLSFSWINFVSVEKFVCVQDFPHSRHTMTKLFFKLNYSYVRKPERVLDSGFQAVDSGFKVMDPRFFVSGTWFLDSHR